MGPFILANGIMETWKVRLSNQGSYQSVHGYIYDGIWKNNLKNGHGKMTYTDGKVYEGHFVDNKREGEGVFVKQSDLSKQKGLQR